MGVGLAPGSQERASIMDMQTVVHNNEVYLSFDPYDEAPMPESVQSPVHETVIDGFSVLTKQVSWCDLVSIIIDGHGRIHRIESHLANILRRTAAVNPIERAAKAHVRLVKRYIRTHAIPREENRSPANWGTSQVDAEEFIPVMVQRNGQYGKYESPALLDPYLYTLWQWWRPAVEWDLITKKPTKYGEFVIQTRAAHKNWEEEVLTSNPYRWQEGDEWHSLPELEDSERLDIIDHSIQRDAIDIYAPQIVSHEDVLYREMDYDENIVSHDVPIRDHNHSAAMVRDIITRYREQSQEEQELATAYTAKAGLLARYMYGPHRAKTQMQRLTKMQYDEAELELIKSIESDKRYLADIRKDAANQWKRRPLIDWEMFGNIHPVKITRNGKIRSYSAWSQIAMASGRANPTSKQKLLQTVEFVPRLVERWRVKQQGLALQRKINAQRDWIRRLNPEVWGTFIQKPVYRQLAPSKQHPDELVARFAGKKPAVDKLAPELRIYRQEPGPYKAGWVR
jgi:hypothetical protein